MFVSMMGNYDTRLWYALHGWSSIIGFGGRMAKLNPGRRFLMIFGGSGSALHRHLVEQSNQIARART